MDVFYGSEKGEIPIIAYPDECWHENACVNDCPEDAIELRIPLSMMVIYR
jgi:adenylylsulfate reductase subunit B